MPWRVYSVAHARAAGAASARDAETVVVAVASGGIVTLSRDPRGESADADGVVAHYN